MTGRILIFCHSRFSTAKSICVGYDEIFPVYHPYLTPGLSVSSQILGISHRRMGASLASCLPVVQLLDADVLHLQPPVQGEDKTRVVYGAVKCKG